MYVAAPMSSQLETQKVYAQYLLKAILVKLPCCSMKQKHSLILQSVASINIDYCAPINTLFPITRWRESFRYFVLHFPKWIS